MNQSIEVSRKLLHDACTAITEDMPEPLDPFLAEVRGLDNFGQVIDLERDGVRP